MGFVAIVVSFRFNICNDRLAEAICIQNRAKLVDICISRIICCCNSIADSELAELEGGNKKSGGGIEDMNKNLKI